MQSILKGQTAVLKRTHIVQNDRRGLSKALADRDGSIPTMVALAAPMLFLLTAGVFDFAALLRQ
ncbi:MAG: hypothetical protein AAF709_09775 [Pseudomonadota bacterium]